MHYQLLAPPVTARAHAQENASAATGSAANYLVSVIGCGKLLAQPHRPHHV